MIYAYFLESPIQDYFTQNALHVMIAITVRSFANITFMWTSADLHTAASTSAPTPTANSDECIAACRDLMSLG